jgi:hypothetical protein
MSTPLKFKELNLRNFLSFGNQLTSIDLSYYGSTLIIGENLDANSNNGAGKCVQAETPISIRNKHTGEVQTISIGKFFESLQKSRGKS